MQSRLLCSLIFAIHVYDFMCVAGMASFDDNGGKSSTLQATCIDAHAVIFDRKSALGIVSVDNSRPLFLW